MLPRGRPHPLPKREGCLNRYAGLPRTPRHLGGLLPFLLGKAGALWAVGGLGWRLMATATILAPVRTQEASARRSRWVQEQGSETGRPGVIDEHPAVKQEHSAQS